MRHYLKKTASEHSKLCEMFVASKGDRKLKLSPVPTCGANPLALMLSYDRVIRTPFVPSDYEDIRQLGYFLTLARLFRPGK
jgi:hypothetical protein